MAAAGVAALLRYAYRRAEVRAYGQEKGKCGTRPRQAGRRDCAQPQLSAAARLLPDDAWQISAAARKLPRGPPAAIRFDVKPAPQRAIPTGPTDNHRAFCSAAVTFSGLSETHRRPPAPRPPPHPTESHPTLTACSFTPHSAPPPPHNRNRTTDFRPSPTSWRHTRPLPPRHPRFRLSSSQRWRSATHTSPPVRPPPGRIRRTPRTTARPTTHELPRTASQSTHVQMRPRSGHPDAHDTVFAPGHARPIDRATGDPLGPTQDASNRTAAGR